MIEGTSLQTTELNIENMFISGSIQGDNRVIDLVANIIYEDLNSPQKLIYDSAINLVNGTFYNKINNTIANLIIDRVTSSQLSNGETITDFNSLSEIDKNKLRALLELFIELKD